MILLKKGLVRLAYMDSNLNQEALAVENKKTNEKVVIPKSEIGENKNLSDLVGKLVDYVELDNGIASMKEAMPIKREILLKQFDKGHILSGRITKIQRWGAFLSINGVSCLIRNCDFASDYTTIADVYKTGDTIDGLVLRKVSENDRISVEKKEKYESDEFIDLSDLEAGRTILGTVRNVKPFGCFVAIANNIDALCPIPPYMEIEEGMRVRCKLSIVDFVESKIRGKVLAVVEEGIEE